MEAVYIQYVRRVSKCIYYYINTVYSMEYSVDKQLTEGTPLAPYSDILENSE